MASSWIRRYVDDFFEYKTPKIVNIRNKKIGFLNRIVQLLIFCYVIGFAVVYKKGYQEFDVPESSVTTKVKGVTLTNYSVDAFNVQFQNQIQYYNRIWDVSDYVVPPAENNAFFVATNIVITPNQKLGLCPEDPTIKGSQCKSDSDCEVGRTSIINNGVETGKCITEVGSCQVHAWCPVEVDSPPLKNGSALLEFTKNFTVLIKNTINFLKFGISRRNILKTTNSSYLSNCVYNSQTDNQCPVFVLEDIVKGAGQDYDEIAKKGAIIAIEIKWDCNLDFDEEHCVPEYKFRRLDDARAPIAPGWNFRYSHYFGNDERTLYKVSGIKFLIIVTGQAGKFSVVPLFVNIGSGIALLALATVICDIVVLYLSSGKEYYKNKKYLYVDNLDGDSEETRGYRDSRDNEVQETSGLTRKTVQA